MRYKFSWILVCAIFQSVVLAQPSRIPSENPRLIIGIVVEQMRNDYIYRFWDKFGEGGFKRLINEGAYCCNASYNHFFTQTAVGHATIYTGATPANHGIVADEWYDRVNNKKLSAVGDETVRTVGGSFDAGHYSPHNLISTTIGDEIKLSTLQQSKVFGISLDPVSAILPAGHTADGAFWFDNENGIWVTSSFYMQNLPNWLVEENNKKLSNLYLSKTWEPSFPTAQYTRCLTDVNPYETGIEGRIVFPYVLPEIAKSTSISKRYPLLKQTPFGNSLTKDMAIATIVHEDLGKDEFTDLLTISFVTTEYVGNAFGPMSIELEDAFLKLDKDLEHFLNFVDEYVGKQNTLIFLTSDHGAAQTPKYLADAKVPTGSFNNQSALALLRSYLNALYGSGEWIKAYYGQQVYLNFELIENSKLKLEDFQHTVAQFLIQFTGVSNTLTASVLQTQQFSEDFRGRIQNGYFPRRSGDVFIHLYPGWVEKSPNVTSHNSSYIYDTHVPLVWYGWKVKRDKIVAPVDMTGIAATISAFMNIAAPNASSGKTITELLIVNY
jgi:predicted AlkP superfamily pyrophosphatase or phosphodiesterase